MLLNLPFDLVSRSGASSSITCLALPMAASIVATGFRILSKIWTLLDCFANCFVNDANGSKDAQHKTKSKMKKGGHYVQNPSNLGSGEQMEMIIRRLVCQVDGGL